MFSRSLRRLSRTDYLKCIYQYPSCEQVGGTATDGKPAGSTAGWSVQPDPCSPACQPKDDRQPGLAHVTRRSISQTAS